VTIAENAVLTARANALEEALALAGTRLNPTVAHRIEQAVVGVRKRLALGVEHTVVALAGGTGSGKSSLSNAISRLNFADVGIKRPTTSEVTAVAWSSGAEALLDWIGVARERRIVQAEELDEDKALSGLVLLDLPDHDSVETAHREVVNRVLPLVDLLVWVVDPQKYADHALHGGYLESAEGTEASTLVLMNQIDTVVEARRDELLADLTRLLESHGLQDVPVLAVSAKTGEGISDVDERLAAVCARQSVAAGRAASEVTSAARLLRSQVPTEIPWRLDEAVKRELPALVAATGLGAVVGQVGAAVRNGFGKPQFPPTDRDAATLIRSHWLTQAGASLPPLWQRSLGDAVMDADSFRAATQQAVSGISLETVRPRLGSRKRGAEKRAAEVATQSREVLRQVLVEAMGNPTRRVLDEHRWVRELAEAAATDGQFTPLPST